MYINYELWLLQQLCLPPIQVERTLNFLSDVIIGTVTPSSTLAYPQNSILIIWTVHYILSDWVWIDKSSAMPVRHLVKNMS